MATDTIEKEVADFKEKIKIEAEELVLKKFPRFMLDLDKLFHVSVSFEVVHRLNVVLVLCFRVSNSK